MFAGFDRLVHPQVEETVERDRQRRFIGAMLTAPFIAGPTLAVTLPSSGVGGALAILCAAIAICWALTLTVSISGKSRVAEAVALAAGLFAVAAATPAGGMAVLLLSASIGFEAFWIAQTRHAAGVGVAAALACFPAAEFFSYLGGDVAGAGTTIWLWLAPVLLLTSALGRLHGIVNPGETRDSQEADTIELVERFDLATIRLTDSGETVSASRGAAAALGIGVEALVGRPLVERVHVGDRVAFLTGLADIGMRQRLSLQLRLRVAMADRPGERFHSFSVEVAADGADGAILLLREAEGETHLREELDAARARADATEIAKGRFLAAVSHELRTPLNSIIGFSDMLLHGLAGELRDRRQEEYVGLIRQSGGHLLSVVNAILDVSKIESGAYSIQPEPFAVKEAIDLCHAMLCPQAEEKGLTFLFRARSDAGEIVGDRRAVQQMIINLAANAIKFTPCGGKVSVEAIRSGNWLRLVVSDTGIGMSESDLGRIGQPFVQVRNDLTREYEGTGLGLSLVKGLVRLHDGEMTIESAPGEGTLVTIALPVNGPRRSVENVEREAANGGAHEAFRKIA